MSLLLAITLVECRMVRETAIETLCAGDAAWTANRDSDESAWEEGGEEEAGGEGG